MPERGTGVFLSGNQFDIEGEENEKGEIYEESWKESISGIKDVYMWRGRDGYREKCSSGTEDPLSDQQKKEPHGRGRLLGSNRKIPDGKARSGLRYFPSCGGCMYQRR